MNGTVSRVNVSNSDKTLARSSDFKDHLRRARPKKAGQSQADPAMAAYTRSLSKDQIYESLERKSNAIVDEINTDKRLQGYLTGKVSAAEALHSRNTLRGLFDSFVKQSFVKNPSALSDFYKKNKSLFPAIAKASTTFWGDGYKVNAFVNTVKAHSEGKIDDNAFRIGIHNSLRNPNLWKKSDDGGFSKVLAGSMPAVGTAIDGYNIYHNIKDGKYYAAAGDGALFALSLVPGAKPVGKLLVNGAKSAGKSIKEFAEAASQYRVKADGLGANGGNIRFIKQAQNLHQGWPLKNVPKGRERIHIGLAEKVSRLRATSFPGKPISKGNIAAGRLKLDSNKVMHQIATSRRKGPLPDKPTPKSQGGLFEPSVHTDANGKGRVMDTDAEFKIFDDLAKKLNALPEKDRKGTLDIFTEMNMCNSCKGIKGQFQKMFPNVRVNVSFKKEFE